MLTKYTECTIDVTVTGAEFDEHEDIRYALNTLWYFENWKTLDDNVIWSKATGTVHPTSSVETLCKDMFKIGANLNTSLGEKRPIVSMDIVVSNIITIHSYKPDKESFVTAPSVNEKNAELVEGKPTHVCPTCKYKEHERSDITGSKTVGLSFVVPDKPELTINGLCIACTFQILSKIVPVMVPIAESNGESNDS